MSGCGEVDLELVFYRDTIRHGTGRGFKQRGMVTGISRGGVR